MRIDAHENQTRDFIKSSFTAVQLQLPASFKLRSAVYSPAQSDNGSQYEYIYDADDTIAAASQEIITSLTAANYTIMSSADDYITAHRDTQPRLFTDIHLGSEVDKKTSKTITLVTFTVSRY